MKLINSSLLIPLFLLLSCQSGSIKPIEVSKNLRPTLDKQFENLKMGHYESAWNGFKELRKKNLNPLELDLIEAGEARTLFLIGESEKSLIALQQLLDRDLSLALFLRKQLRFYLADALEEVGNLSGALASLDEILGLSPSLEEQFILSVRKVTLQIKLNSSPSEIKRVSAQCQDLLQKLLLEDLPPEKLAQILVEASWSSRSFYNESQYGEFLLNTQKWTQKWKAQAIQIKDSKWGQVALRQVQLQFKDLWLLSLEPGLPSTMDPKSAILTKKKTSVARLNHLLDVIQALELEFPVPFPKQDNSNELSLAEFLGVLKAQTQIEIDTQLESQLPERKGQVDQNLWQSITPLPEANL